MGDVSAGDLGSSSSPLSGLDASDYQGYGAGGNQINPSSGISSGQLLGAGALGLGALGVGSLMAQGPGNLPPQYLQAEGQVPWLQSTGQGMVTSGEQALTMAQNGQLTPEQQAQVNVYGTGLTNQARQMYSNMGVNPDQDTSFLSTSAQIDTQVNAMAQSQIQSTIALGLGEVNAGSGFESAANQILLQAGQAQLQLDQQYSSSLTSAFGAIGTLFGAVAGAAVGGPAGATAGSAVGSSLGKMFS